MIGENCELSNDDDDESDDESDDENQNENENENGDIDDNDDEKQQEALSGNISDFSKIHSKRIDYKLIERQLLLIGFRAKIYLPLIQQAVQFRSYGFKNKQDRKRLFLSTKQLMQKYPKQRKKKKKKQHQFNYGMEGHVDDTGSNDMMLVE